MGPFDSVYASAPEGAAAPHLQRSTGAAVIFAVADVDWLFDPFSLQRTNVGDQVLVRPLNDNLTFLMNMIEYASGDESLIAIRSRGRLQRPFSRVAALFQAAERRFREEEQALTRRVADIEDRIGRSSRTAGATGALPAGIEDDVKAFRAELLAARRELRAVRRRIREEVDSLGRRLTVTNLLAGPAMVLMFAGAVFAVRRRRRSA